jgi:hypothetical protein
LPDGQLSACQGSKYGSERKEDRTRHSTMILAVRDENTKLETRCSYKKGRIKKLGMQFAIKRTKTLALIKVITRLKLAC